MRRCLVMGGVLVAVAAPLAAVALAHGASRPTATASIDSQRRLVVVYSSQDTWQYGGHVYLDNDPRDPVETGGDSTYGAFMYCNNKSTCKASFALPAQSGTGPYTFKSDPLDCTRFPAGTWYVQVEGYNQDPYPSTRQWEESDVITLKLGACKSGGGGGGNAGGGGGTSSGPSVTVTLPQTVTIRHQGGGVEKVKGPAEIKPFDQFVSGGSVVTIPLKAGKVVLDKGTTLEYAASGHYSSWIVRKGEVWQNGMVVVRSSDVAAQAPTGGSFLLAVTPGGATIDCYAGPLELKRGTHELATLKGGQEAKIAKGGAPKIGAAKTPAKPFWKP